MTRGLCIIVLITLAGGTGCSNSPEENRISNTESSQESQEVIGASDPVYWTSTFDENKPCHWLMITPSSQEAFDDDEHITLGGISESLSGHVVLYVNGSPWAFLTDGSGMRVAEFLEPGVNKIEVRGKHETSISVRVLTSDFYDDRMFKDDEVGGYRETIAKVFVPPERENGSVEFTVDDVKGTPFETLSQSGEKRDAAEKSLRDLLGNLQLKFEEHDGKGFANLLFRNRLKLAQKLNTDIDDRRAQPGVIGVCSIPNAKLTEDLSQSKIVWGERIVLVWSGKIAEDSSGAPTEPYWCQIVIEDKSTEDNDRILIPPLRYGMIDGEWVRF